MKSVFVRSFLGFSLFLIAAFAHAESEGDWIQLFDGHSLQGWRAAEHPASFRVENGAIVCEGERGHLFYEGEALKDGFEDFELVVSFRAKAGANSGVFFHTAWQETSWPKQGFEVQVDNSQQRHGDYLENKMTGSLYGIRNVYKALAADDAWSTLRIVVQRPRVQIEVNGIKTVDYIEPAPFTLPDGTPSRQLGRGTFALQGHDPASRVDYRELKVRRLSPSAEITRGPAPNALAIQMAGLAKDNFPLVDLHTHLKGDLTTDKVLSLMYTTGMGAGIATNGGVGFPIQNDAAAIAFAETMKATPFFAGLQAEGREWVSMFSPEARARFDYIFTDAMTFTNANGRRLRLWIPAETEIGPDEQAFMDYLADQAAKIIREEPIDIYVNPTYLPDAISAKYDALWTEPRMKKIIDAAVEKGVAIEINARYKIPSEKFIRLAKAAGAKFTIGTNNTSSADYGDWSYPLEMIRKVNLTWKDMFVPGKAPSRAQREVRMKN